MTPLCDRCLTPIERPKPQATRPVIFGGPPPPPFPAYRFFEYGIFLVVYATLLVTIILLAVVL